MGLGSNLEFRVRVQGFKYWDPMNFNASLSVCNSGKLKSPAAPPMPKPKHLQICIHIIAHAGDRPGLGHDCSARQEERQTAEAQDQRAVVMLVAVHVWAIRY